MVKIIKSKGCPRLDGLCNLTSEEKADRDARAQYWMNQRKIERVAKASGLLPKQA